MVFFFFFMYTFNSFFTRKYVAKRSVRDDESDRGGEKKRAKSRLCSFCAAVVIFIFSSKFVLRTKWRTSDVFFFLKEEHVGL